MAPNMYGEGDGFDAEKSQISGLIGKIYNAKKLKKLSVWELESQLRIFVCR